MGMKNWQVGLLATIQIIGMFSMTLAENSSKYIALAIMIIITVFAFSLDYYIHSDTTHSSQEELKISDETIESVKTEQSIA